LNSGTFHLEFLSYKSTIILGVYSFIVYE
jgi:hypothetical protein